MDLGEDTVQAFRNHLKGLRRSWTSTRPENLSKLIESYQNLLFELELRLVEKGLKEAAQLFRITAKEVMSLAMQVCSSNVQIQTEVKQSQETARINARLRGKGLGGSQCEQTSQFAQSLLREAELTTDLLGSKDYALILSEALREEEMRCLRIFTNQNKLNEVEQYLRERCFVIPQPSRSVELLEEVINGMRKPRQFVKMGNFDDVLNSQVIQECEDYIAAKMKAISCIKDLHERRVNQAIEESKVEIVTRFLVDRETKKKRGMQVQTTSREEQKVLLSEPAEERPAEQEQKPTDTLYNRVCALQKLRVIHQSVLDYVLHEIALILREAGVVNDKANQITKRISHNLDRYHVKYSKSAFIVREFRESNSKIQINSEEKGVQTAFEPEIIDLGRDFGKELGRDLGRDLGKDLGKDLGRDLGRDLGKDSGARFVMSRSRKEKSDKLENLTASTYKGVTSREERRKGSRDQYQDRGKSGQRRRVNHRQEESSSLRPFTRQEAPSSVTESRAKNEQEQHRLKKRRYNQRPVSQFLKQDREQPAPNARQLDIDLDDQNEMLASRKGKKQSHKISRFVNQIEEEETPCDQPLLSSEEYFPEQAKNMNFTKYISKGKAESDKELQGPEKSREALEVKVNRRLARIQEKYQRKMAVMTLRVLQQRIEELQAKLKKSTRQLKESEAKNQALSSQLQSKKARLDQVEGEMAKWVNQMANYKHMVQNYELAIKNNSQKLCEAENKLRCILLAAEAEKCKRERLQSLYNRAQGEIAMLRMEEDDMRSKRVQSFAGEQFKQPEPSEQCLQEKEQQGLAEPRPSQSIQLTSELIELESSSDEQEQEKEQQQQHDQEKPAKQEVKEEDGNYCLPNEQLQLIFKEPHLFKEFINISPFNRELPHMRYKLRKGVARYIESHSKSCSKKKGRICEHLVRFYNKLREIERLQEGGRAELKSKVWSIEDLQSTATARKNQVRH